MGKIASHVRGHFVAYLALFFALGGTSIAAVNALPRNSVGTAQLKNGAVTKTKINTKTITALKRSRGPQGPQGATGSQGPKGDTGSQGPPGPITGTAPSRLTMTGLFNIDGYEVAGGELGTGISFPFELSAAPTAAVEVPFGGINPDPTHCPGSPDSPTAAAGYLCVYDRGAVNAQAPCQTDLCIADVSSHGTTSDFGAQIWTFAKATGHVAVVGAWAVTAP